MFERCIITYNFLPHKLTQVGITDGINEKNTIVGWLLVASYQVSLNICKLKSYKVRHNTDTMA
jgi:hypothetical protein